MGDASLLHYQPWDSCDYAAAIYLLYLYHSDWHLAIAPVWEHSDILPLSHVVLLLRVYRWMGRAEEIRDVVFLDDACLRYLGDVDYAPRMGHWVFATSGMNDAGRA